MVNEDCQVPQKNIFYVFSILGAKGDIILLDTNHPKGGGSKHVRDSYPFNCISAASLRLVPRLISLNFKARSGLLTTRLSRSRRADGCFRF
jgi:hypothetical protein